MRAFFQRIIIAIVSFLQMLGFSGPALDKWTARPSLPAEPVSIEITVDRDARFQTVNGFGSSACWWAQDMGFAAAAEETARLLYSDDGLALNIYRYNVGAGEKDNPNTRIWGNRATESFYRFNGEKGRYEYDFTRDAAAQHMLDLCLSYGNIDTVVLFANSPHFSMTVSGQATGGKKSYVSNLRADCYEAFADYMVTIARHFIEKGVPVKYISPVNEPQWEWGGKWVGQEGCHYEFSEVFALMKVFAAKIKQSGLEVKLMAPESGELGDGTVDWFRQLCADPDIAEALGSLSYHSYWNDGNQYKKYAFGQTLNSESFPYPVDMTEWSELPLEHSSNDFTGAVIQARIISQDLVLSGANSWSAWLGVNNYSEKNGAKWSDALLMMTGDASEVFVCDRYYTLAHFSKFIPSGSVRIAAGPGEDLCYFTDDAGSFAYPDYDVSAFETPDGKIVIVLVNAGGEKHFFLNDLPSGGGIDVYQSTADYKLKNIYSGPAEDYITAPANSVTTIEWE